MAEREPDWEFEDFLWPGVGALRVTGTEREVHVSPPPGGGVAWAGGEFRFHASLSPDTMEWTRFALGPSSGLDDDGVDDFRSALSEVMSDWLSDPASRAMLARSARADEERRARAAGQALREAERAREILARASEGDEEALRGMEEAIRALSAAEAVLKGTKG